MIICLYLTRRVLIVVVRDLKPTSGVIQRTPGLTVHLDLKVRLSHHTALRWNYSPPLIEAIACCTLDHTFKSIGIPYI